MTSVALRLAVATLALAVLPALAVAADPQQCWQARETVGTGRFIPRTVALQDAFGTFSTRLARTRGLCNPTSIDGAPLDDATAHLTCYDARDDRLLTGRFFTEYVQITNALGSQTIAVQKPQQLCVPGEQGIDPAPPAPSALDLDAYRCYKAKAVPGFPSPVADLAVADAFAARAVTTRGTYRFCTPAAIDGGAILHPAAHLACYRVDDTTPEPLVANVLVHTENRFGALALTARTASARYLCLPTTATILNAQ